MSSGRYFFALMRLYRYLSGSRNADSVAVAAYSKTVIERMTWSPVFKFVLSKEEDFAAYKKVFTSDCQPEFPVGVIDTALKTRVLCDLPDGTGTSPILSFQSVLLLLKGKELLQAHIRSANIF